MKKTCRYCKFRKIYSQYLVCSHPLMTKIEDTQIIYGEPTYDQKYNSCEYFLPTFMVKIQNLIDGIIFKAEKRKVLRQRKKYIKNHPEEAL